MAKSKILIIEDEEDIRELLTYTLEKENYETITAGDGETGLELSKTLSPDLIILDLMLPGIDGHQVCYQMKHNDTLKYIPIIMLTAKNEEADEVIGLAIGADDYIGKPFSSRKLIARVSALLRRSKPVVKVESSEECIQINELLIDPMRHEVKISGEEIKLTPIEFKILQCLCMKPGRVFTRSQIIDKAQGADVYITERAIDVHIVSLRKKLKSYSGMVETVRGIGYRFKEK